MKCFNSFINFKSLFLQKILAHHLRWVKKIYKIKKKLFSTQILLHVYGLIFKRENMTLFSMNAEVIGNQLMNE